MTPFIQLFFSQINIKQTINTNSVMKVEESKAHSQYSNESNVFSLKSINNSHKSKLDISLDLTLFCHKQLKNLEPSDSQLNLFRQSLQGNLKVQSRNQNLRAVAGKRKVRFLGDIIGLEPENELIFQRLMDNPLAQKPNQKGITIARPASNYCQICRQNFEDYLKHIQHVNHKNKCQKTCKTSKNIKQLLVNTEYNAKRPQTEKYIRNSSFDQQNYKCSSKVRIISNERTQTPIPFRLKQFSGQNYRPETKENSKRSNKSISQQKLAQEQTGLEKSDLLLLS